MTSVDDMVRHADGPVTRSVSVRFQVRPRRLVAAAAGVAALVALVVGGVVAVRLGTASQWVAQAVPGPMGSHDLVGITCSSSSECLIQADNDQLLGSVDDASSWAIAEGTAGPSGQPNGMSCNNDGCVAAASLSGGQEGQIVGSYGDLGWGAASGIFPFVRPTYFINGHMSCTTAGDFCVLINSMPSIGDATGSNLGSAQTWVSRPFVDNNDTEFNPVSTVSGTVAKSSLTPPELPSCPDVNVCFAVGGATAWRTLDGGRRWTPVMNLLTRHLLTSFTALSCTSRSGCMLGTDADDVAVTQNGGATWRVRHVPGLCPGGSSSQDCGGIVGLACVSDDTCYAVSGDGGSTYDSEIDVTTNAGVTWSSMSLPFSVDLSAIACARLSDCWAVGSTAPISSSTSPVILHLG